MGAKYTSQAASGFNASPPPDDGTVSASNQVFWGADVLNKVGTPLKTFIEAVNTALVSFTNFGSSAVSSTYSTVAADHMTTLEANGTFTISLMDASTIGAGYVVNIKNVGSGVITVGLVTNTDTLDGTANGTVTIPANGARTFKTVLGTNGYMSIDGLKAVTTAATTSNDNTPASTAFVQSVASPTGQCVLTYVSSTSIVLLPRNGNKVVIGGSTYTIGSSGIASGDPTTASNFLNGTANQILTASTVLDVYVFNNSGTLALDFVTQAAHSADTTTGVEIHTGDASRTLVGKIQTNGSSHFQSNMVRSWFNDSGVAAMTSGSAGNVTTSVGATVEISSAARISFLAWSGEKFHAMATGQSTVTGSSGMTAGIDVSLDGSVVGSASYGMNYTANAIVQLSSTGILSPTEGAHFATVLGGSSNNGAASNNFGGVALTLTSKLRA